MIRWLVVLFCCVPIVYGDMTVSSGTVSDLTSAATLFISQADTAYAKRSDLAEAKIAWVMYQRAFSADSKNTEAYWKASRVAWWIGDQSESRSDKLLYFQKGIDLAKAAVALNPDSVEGHFWLAANYGSFGESKGVLKSLSLVKPIRQEIAMVNRLNDRFRGGGGYRILGVVDYKVPGFAGGSKKRALEELNKSLAIDANDPATHYYLAEYYRVMGEKEKSQAELKVLRALVVPPDSQPELEAMLKKAERFFG